MKMCWWSVFSTTLIVTCYRSGSPCVWRRRRPIRRPCTAVRRSLSWWGGRWSTQHWGRSGRAPPLLRTPAAEPAPCPCPSPRSAAHSMTPTWTMPPPEETHRNAHITRYFTAALFYHRTFSEMSSASFFFFFTNNQFEYSFWILWFKLKSSEHVLISLLLYDSKLKEEMISHDFLAFYRANKWLIIKPSKIRSLQVLQFKKNCWFPLI